MKQKMNLKSGMFNGLPAYACALLLLAAGLVLSVLYAVTVGSAELSVGEVYRVILYELFRCCLLYTSCSALLLTILSACGGNDDAPKGRGNNVPTSVSSAVTVSYTHLDVYKRQAFGRA